jgi:uncharacterized protein (TIGR00296 family)
MTMYSEEDGELAIRIARASLDRIVKGVEMPEIDVPEKFKKNSGAFVTLNTYPDNNLRGCIGYPEPYFPLRDSLIKGAMGATRDPRFPRLRKDELDRIIVEVSLLTPPELIVVGDTKEYPKRITVGRDGLIIEQGTYKGLLLPQVPVEYNWDVEEFLAHTCMKAGLPPDSWLDPGTKIFRFGGDVFGETEPRGKVTRKVLDGS